jgi:hypothetical protein
MLASPANRILNVHEHLQQEHKCVPSDLKFTAIHLNLPFVKRLREAIPQCGAIFYLSKQPM